MIWIQHDLYKNFLKSFNSGDINLSLDIFRSELSDILTQKTNELFSLLDKVGIKHNKKMSYEELLDLVLREMKTNEKFVRGLAFVIGENNKVNKKNPKISWVKLLDTIKRGIEQITVYFENNLKAEKLFRRKSLEMLQLKSSVTGDDNRELNKKDNTIKWVIGIAIVGIAGYLIYRHFRKIEDAKLRAESLNPLNSNVPQMELGGGLPISNNNAMGNNINNNVMSTDPSYNVSSDVLMPLPPIQQMPNANNNVMSNGNGLGTQNGSLSQVNNNVPNSTINIQVPMQQQNMGQNVSSLQQNNVNI